MAPRNSTIQQQWAPASKKDPVKKVRLDLSGKIRNSAEERQLKTRQQDKKQSYKKEPLSIAVGVVQHRRGRHCWGVAVARGRGTGLCEEVGTGADSPKCSQRGAFSLRGGVLLCSVC